MRPAIIPTSGSYHRKADNMNVEQDVIDRLETKAKTKAVEAMNLFVSEYGRKPSETEAAGLFREMMEDLALMKILSAQ